MTNKMNGHRPTSDHKQECKNIYLLLFNKYSEKISGKTFGTRISILNKLKDEEDYNELLTQEEQDNLFNELMNR